MPTFRRLVAAVAAFGTATAVLVPAAPAAAATHCTGWGAMPARVALHQDRTVVTITLRGSAGCHNQRTDNGATASLVYPSGSTENMRWRHFGGIQKVTMYVNIVRSGSYVLRHGNVQVYDHRYERVAWSWHRTTVVVKRAAHIFRPSASGGVVSGRSMRYTKYGWAGSHQRVWVQRKPVGTSSWHTLGSVLPSRKGYASFRTATSSGYTYRMFVHPTDAVWGTSAQVRG